MPPASQTAREQLTDRRLEALEESVKGHARIERDTDHLRIELTHLTEMFGEFKGESRSDLAEFKAEVRERDTNTQASLARLHARFDAIEKNAAREEGARAVREETTRAARVSKWQALAVTVATCSVIVALLTLLLK